jgi:hypothetical protein
MSKNYILKQAVITNFLPQLGYEAEILLVKIITKLHPYLKKKNWIF